MAEKPFIVKHGLEVREGASVGITFHDLGSTNSITIKSASSGSPSVPLILPNADGGAGTYLQNDGGGILSWSTSGIGAMTSWDLQGTTGSETIQNSNAVSIIGGSSNIVTAVSATDTLTINWSAALADLSDVSASPAPSTNDVLTWTGAQWEAAAGGGGGGGAFTNAGGVVSVTGETGSPSGEDFVFGSTQLNDMGGSNGELRMLFDRAQGAFRAGRAETSQWNTRAPYSVAFGKNNKPNANYSGILGGNLNEVEGDCQYSAVTHGLGNVIDKTNLALDNPWYASAGGRETATYLYGQHSQSSGFDGNPHSGNQTSVVTMHASIKLGENENTTYTLDGSAHDPGSWTSGADVSGYGARLFIRPNQLAGNPGYDGSAGGLFPFVARLKLSGTIIWYGEILGPTAGRSFSSISPVNHEIFNTIAVTFGGEAFIHRTGTAVGGIRTSVPTTFGNEVHHPSATAECMILNSGIPQWCSDGRYARLYSHSWLDGFYGDRNKTSTENVASDPHYHVMSNKTWNLADVTGNDGFNRGKHIGDHDNWLNEELGFGGTSDGTEWVFPTMNVGGFAGGNSGGDLGWAVATAAEESTAWGGGATRGFIFSCYAKTENDYTGTYPALTYGGEDGVWVEFSIHPNFTLHDGSQPSGINIIQNYPAYSTLRVELVESVGGILVE